jgi:hypothetical protein
MNRNIRIDYPEFIENYINNNTEQGDKVLLTVRYNGRNKPSATLTLTTRAGKKEKDITPYFHDKPNFVSPYNGETMGYSDWVEYIELFAGAEIMQVCSASLRNFEYKVELV